MVFFIKKARLWRTHAKKAEQIFNDKKLLKELSHEEAHLIGYTSVSEKISADMEQRRKISDSI